MKQIIFLLMVSLLPIGIIAQVDDLYYVPTKKKVKKEIKINSVSNNAISTENQTQYGTNIVRIGKTTKSNLINGIDEDAYNRRNTYSVDTICENIVDEEVYNSEEETYVEDYDYDSDYIYSSRIVRFHSPRRAVILSSPLYWDVVYNSGLDSWTIYDDGIYWNVYTDYTTSWNWYVEPGWRVSFGWGYNPWLWGWNCHHHHWYHNHHWNNIHHGHHGFPNWHRPFNGGYRNAIYTNRNGNGRGHFVPRATGPVRAASGIRSGNVARTNKNVSQQYERTIRKTTNNERVYNRPSSTRSNVKRVGTKENRRNNTNETKVNRTNRQQTNTTPNVNNRIQNTQNNAVKKSDRSNAEKRTSKKVRESNESKKNNNSSYNRSSVSRNNNSRSSNSRSSFSNSSSRNSGFSGNSSRGGGGRSGGSRGGGRR